MREPELEPNTAPVVGRIGPLGEFSQPIHASCYTDGVGMQDLGTLVDGLNSVCHAIHEAGMVAGQSETIIADELRRHALLYADASGMQDLGALPGSFRSTAFGINDQTPPHIVGESIVDAGKASLERATRWRNGVILNLGVLP